MTYLQGRTVSFREGKWDDPVGPLCLDEVTHCQDPFMWQNNFLRSRPFMLGKTPGRRGVCFGSASDRWMNDVGIWSWIME